jgi:O-antigen ligase
MNLSKELLFFTAWVLLSTSMIVVLQVVPNRSFILYVLVPFILIIAIVSDKKQDSSATALLSYTVFFSWCTLSVFYTKDQPITLNYLSTMIGNIILWYTVSRLMRQSRRIARWIFFLCILVFFHAVQALVIPVEFISKVGYGRAQGLFSNSNALGVMMWYGFISISLLLLTTDYNKWIFMFYIIGVILCVYVLLESGSRKSLGAVMSSLLIIIFRIKSISFKQWIYPFTGLLIGYLFIGKNVISETAMINRVDYDNLVNGGEKRTNLIVEGIHMFLDNPVFGVGLGSFKFYSSSHLMAHNDFVEVIASTGLVGLLLYSLMYFSFFNINNSLLRISHTHRYGIWGHSFLFGFIILGLGRPTFLDPIAIMIFAFYYSFLRNLLIQTNSKL